PRQFVLGELLDADEIFALREQMLHALALKPLKESRHERGPRQVPHLQRVLLDFHAASRWQHVAHMLGQQAGSRGHSLAREMAPATNQASGAQKQKTSSAEE